MAICAKDGCKANALTDSDDNYCYQHSTKPLVMEKRKRARSKGGSRGKLPVADVTIATVQDVKNIIMEAINGLRSCSSESIVAKSRALGYLCGIALTAIEKGDLEERIAKLEEAQAESVR